MRLSTRALPAPQVFARGALMLALMATPAFAADAEVLKAIEDARKAAAAATQAADEARKAADAARAEVARLERELAAAKAAASASNKAPEKVTEKAVADKAASAKSPEAAKPEFSIYGVVHLSVDALDDGSNRDLAVSSNSSRLGIRGSKALNEDWTVNYQFEWLVGATEETNGAGSNNNFSRRNQWVGLKNSLGELRVGRLDTPLKNIRGKADFFHSDQLGENRTFTNVSGFDARPDNVIQYELGSGEWRGLFFYSADTGSDAFDTNSRDLWSAALTYEAGLWYLGLGYEERNNPNTTTQKGHASALRAAVTRKIGENGKAAFFYESAEDVGGLIGHDRDLWGGGYSHRTGDWVWKFAWYAADDRADKADTGGRLISFGADRAFGKNTILYAVYGMVDNDASAAFKVIGVGHDGNMNVVNGANNSGLSVGVKHQF